jgi:hypothetical protein
MTQPEDTSDDFKYLLEGSYPVDDGKPLPLANCKNCSFNVNGVCIKRRFKIFDDSQWCKDFCPRFKVV